MKNNEIEKSYYHIGEVAKILDLTTATLRFWEKEFDFIKPYKDKKGSRYFNRKDLEIIRTIHYLTKKKGYTLQGAKEVLKTDFIKEATKADMINTLKNIKTFLLEIKNEL
jgi:DNA-binding transcriptional MerR regulator